MKSFKEYLEESWKKYRLKRKNSRGDRKTSNQRSNRLYTAWNNAVNRGATEEKLDTLADAHEEKLSKVLLKSMVRGAKMRGKPVTNASATNDDGEMGRNFQEFQRTSKVRGAFGRAVSGEDASIRKSRFTNMINDALAEWPTTNKSKIKYLQRTAPEQRKLGIRSVWPWNSSRSR